MTKGRVIRLFLIASFALGAGRVIAQQQTRPMTIGSFFSETSYCLLAGCNSPSCSPPITFPLASFNDPLPPGSKLRSASLDWRMGNNHSFSWQGIPAVTINLDGTALGTQTIISNYASCFPSGAQTYTFASADYASGFPGYVYGSTGQNTIYTTLTVLDAGVTYGDSVYVTLIYEPPAPFAFSITDASPETDRRIILSNSRSEYPYPRFQSYGGQDNKVPMVVQARGQSGNFESGLTVYLRIVDPPDPAPYMNLSQNTLAHAGDNVGPLATLEGSDISPVPNMVGVYQGTSQTYGTLNFTLSLPAGTAAGNNYQIEAAFDPAFPAGTTTKSGTLTAWKRVFVEKHRMLRNGMFLIADARSGDSTITVATNYYGGNQGTRTRITRGDRIILVHAPAVDRSNVLNGWYSEEHDVADVVAGAGGYIVTLGTRNGNTIVRQMLAHDFGRDPSPSALPEWADAMARLSGATLSSVDYFDAADDLVINSVFPEAFTEYYVLGYTTFTSIPVPDFGTVVEPTLEQFGDKWATITEPTPNHQLLFIADSDRSPAPGAGLTVSQVPNKTSSWVFRGTIETEVVTHGAVNYGADPNLWAKKTAVHELAHEWRANTPWGQPDHCPSTTKTYNDSTLFCLLAANDPQGSETQRANGIARFHLLQLSGGSWHSEYLEIRKRADPFLP